MSGYFPTKYDSARDEVIDLLSDEIEGYGMRDDMSGDVDAPTGWFVLVVIPEVVDLGTGYGDHLEQLSTEYSVTADDVAGVHIVTHNSQGFVSVETFDSEEEARKEFDCRAGRYEVWSDEERDEEDNIYICPVTGHGYHNL